MNSGKINESTIDSLNEYSWDNRYTSYDEALSHAEQALELSKKTDYKAGLAYAKLNMAVCYFLKSMNKEAFPLLQETLVYFDQNREEKGYIVALLHIGNIYESYGDYEKALDFTQKALIKAKEINYLEGEGDVQAVLGLIYIRLTDYKSAQKSYTESLKIREELGNTMAIASSLNRLAQSFCLSGDYDRALEFYSQSHEIREKIEKYSGISWTYLGLASTYEYMGKLNEANKYYSMGADHKETDIRCKAQCLMGSGRINRKLNNLDIAEKELHEAERIAINLKAKPLLYEIHLELAKYYEKKNNDLKALENYKKYHLLKEEVHNNESANRLKNQQIVFAIEKSEKEKEIFQLRNVELKAAYDEIHEKNQEITDSIEYALRIQSALLPKEDYLKEILPHYFTLYLPRDIVSGDYYWGSKIEDKVIIIAADCTGHGVPGAFMSMLGMSFLNDIVNKRKTTDPAKIISRLRKMIIKALKQKDDDIDSQDGMDIAICVFDYTNESLTFAGAYNPLYMIRDGEIRIITADKMPVGISSKLEESFTNHTIDLRKGDRFYIFSDGYHDQFGGKNGKKLKSAPFRRLLLETSGLTIPEQKLALHNFFIEWRGDYLQIDDVIVIGIEFN